MSSPVVTITNNAATTGEVRLSWNNSAADADWFAYRIYVRETGSVAWTMVREFTTGGPNFVYDLYAFAANSSTDIGVAEVLNDVDGFTEQVFTPQTFSTPGIDKYYLVNPADPTKNIYLNHVTGDSGSDVDEVGVFNLIGRGRKVDRGTRLGLEGSLDVTLFPTPTRTVRQQWNELRELRQAGCDAIVIRSPFGDVTKASITAVERTRVSAGTQDYMTVKLNYVEVA